MDLDLFISAIAALWGALAIVIGAMWRFLDSKLKEQALELARQRDLLSKCEIERSSLSLKIQHQANLLAAADRRIMKLEAKLHGINHDSSWDNIREAGLGA